MIYLGIDPGKLGGIAIVGDFTQAWKTPETERDLHDLIAELGGPNFAVIEKVHSSPQMGVKSAFTFGRGYGFLRGLLTAFCIPFEEVSPQKWQKAMACLTHGDKNVSKAKAQQLWPHLKITHGVADALLIAEYCRRTRMAQTNGATA